MFGKKVMVLSWIFILGATAVLSAAEPTSEELPTDQGLLEEGLQKMRAATQETTVKETATGSTEIASVETQGVGSAVQQAQEEVRDPFQPQIKAEADAEEAAPKTEQAVKVTLQGVGFGSQDSYAILNGDIYYVEEERKGIKLVAVRKGEADVLVNGAMQTLRLFDETAMRKSVGGRHRSKALNAS